MIRIVNRSCFISICLGCLVCLGTLAHAVPQGLEGDDPNSPDAQQRGIWIEPKAFNFTAQFCIDGGDPHSPESDQDKKRTKYGIGEFLTLTVMGKENLMGDESKIEWEIEDKSGLVEVSEEDDSLKGRKIDIELCSDVLCGGNVVVTVKTQLATAKITLNVVFPENIVGAHIPANGQAGTEAIIPGVLLTDNEMAVGASMSLKLTLLPLDVSFDGLRIVERDAESPRAVRPVHPAQTIGKEHPVNGVLLRVNSINVVCDDQVGMSWDRTILADLISNGLIMPQEWEWVCNWNVADAENGNTNQGLISGAPYIQKFLYEHADAGSIFKVTVTKFGRTATRENTPTPSPINFQ